MDKVKTNNTTVGSKVIIESMDVTIVRMTVEAAFAFFGVAGNILVCFVIATRPKMKKIMNCYLLSLAVADLGILLILFPLAIVNQQHSHEYFFGKAFCLYVGPTLEIFIPASIWSITVIAIERYFAVVKSSRLAIPKRGNIPKRVYFIILGVWLLSFLLFCLPLFFIWKYKEGDSQFTSKCYLENIDLFKIFTIYNGVVTYLLPLLSICYTYCGIMTKLRESEEFHVRMRSETVEDPVSQTQINSTRRERREAKARNMVRKTTNRTKRILTPLVILFALSMLPINTFRFMNAFWEGTSRLSYHSILFNVAVFCFLINSTMNPLIYFITSQEFRTGFRHIYDSAKTQCRKFAHDSKCAEAKMTGYWPSSFSKHAKKRTRPISCHLDRSSLINKGFTIWDETPKHDLYTCGTKPVSRAKKIAPSCPLG